MCDNITVITGMHLNVYQLYCYVHSDVHSNSISLIFFLQYYCMVWYDDAIPPLITALCS